MNCFGRNEENFSTFLEPNTDLCDIKYAFYTFNMFKSIMIFPYKDKLKVTGKLKDLDFSYSEKSKFLKEYNNIKLHETLEHEKLEEYLKQNPWLETLMHNKVLKEMEEWIDKEPDEEANEISKFDLPIKLHLLVNKINELLNSECSIIEKKKSIHYLFSLVDYRLIVKNYSPS